MADKFAVTVDASSLLAALSRLGTAAQPAVDAVCKETAHHVALNAKANIARQTRGTGATATGVEVRPSTISGYVVTTWDVLSEQTIAARFEWAATSQGSRPYKRFRKARAQYEQDLHTGLWLEHGTIRGKKGSHTRAPRPWLFPASEVEQGPHRRRLAEALTEAIHETGLGD